MQNTSVFNNPPRAPPVKYDAPLGTRWAKEMAAAGGAAAFDLPTDPKAIGPWILGECVGKGASGRVKIAKHRRTGQLAAVKILPIAPLMSSRMSLATQQAKSDKQRLGIDREITMMKLMNHPNIMRIYDVYEGDKELFLVLEYVEGGELFDFLVNRGKLPPNEALIYFRQILYGLNYAHTFSIIHRDLKPENILIASLSPPLIKIADWGMAAFAPPSLQLETSCGSPHYASPEIVNGEKYQGNATDIWSCGVILYALLTGKLPFDDKDVRTLLSIVKTGIYEMPDWIDPLAKDLISRMLVVDVKERITIPQIFSHPWLISQPSIQLSGHSGITYSLLPPPLPPSPGILARPIASPDVIDPELFASLRIIWGRYTDANGDSIRRDLCSPAGHGVHAKAFYFLLGKYREEASKNRNDDPELDSKDFFSGFEPEIAHSTGLPGSPAFVTRKYEVPQNHPVFSNLQALSSTPSKRPSVIFIGQSAIATSRKRTVTDGGILTGRERLELRISSRPVSRHSHHKAQADMSRLPVLVSPKNDDLMGSSKATLSGVGRGAGGTRVLAPRRGYTYSMLPERKKDSPSGFQSGTGVGFSQHLQKNLRPNGPAGSSSSSNRPRSSIGFSPTVGGAEKGGHTARNAITAIRQSLGSPRPLTNSPTSSVTAGMTALALDAPHRASPETDTAFRRRAEEPILHYNEQRQMKGSKLSTVVHVHQAHGHHRVRVRDDKENRVIEEDWNHVVAANHVDHGVGVGLGVTNRDVGKDLRNIPTTVSSAKGKKEKEKKGRPPPLELPPLNQKRSTLALLGSPIALSSPIHLPLSANKTSPSPVVGEFKGWFSNLFNWKHSNSSVAIIYSPDDVQGTRSNVSRILEEAGVVVSSGQHLVEQGDSLICRIDHPCVDATTGFPLKNVRFRVEFKTGPGPVEPQPVMQSIMEENAYFVASPKQVASSNISGAAYSPVTPVHPVPTSGLAASRPRTSFLLGGGGRSSAHGTPLPSPALLSSSGFSKGVEPNLPPGCLCAMALIYEKGSITTFKHVWKKVKEEYGDVGNGGYPCLSPAVPNTPYIETHKGTTVVV